MVFDSSWMARNHNDRDRTPPRFNVSTSTPPPSHMPPIPTSWRSLKAKDGEKMYWTMSDSSDWLLHPSIPGAKVGHIHLHRNNAADEIQVWLLGVKKGDWVDISEEYKTCGTGDGQTIVRHPLFVDLVLKRRHDSNAPSFVKEKPRKMVAATTKSTPVEGIVLRKSSRKRKERVN